MAKINSINTSFLLRLYQRAIGNSLASIIGNLIPKKGTNAYSDTRGHQSKPAQSVHGTPKYELNKLCKKLGVSRITLKAYLNDRGIKFTNKYVLCANSILQSIMSDKDTLVDKERISGINVPKEDKAKKHRKYYQGANNTKKQMKKSEEESNMPGGASREIYFSWEQVKFHSDWIELTHRGRYFRVDIDGAKETYNLIVLFFIINNIERPRIELNDGKIVSHNLEIIYKYIMNGKYSGILSIKEIKEYRPDSEEEFLVSTYDLLAIDEYKSACINWLCEKHSSEFKIIDLKEHNYNLSEDESDPCFIFTFKIRSRNFLVWESSATGKSKATHIFKCHTRNYSTALSELVDYITSNISYKRERLRQKNNTM